MTEKATWLNKAYSKVCGNPGIKIRGLALKLRCSASYCRDLIKELVELQMVRIELEKPAGAYLLFDPDWTPPKPKPEPKPKNTCRTYKVDPSQVWKYRGGIPIPDELRTG